MDVYPLRHIPDKTWRRAKSIAAKRGTTVRQLLLEALKNLSIKNPQKPRPPA